MVMILRDLFYPYILYHTNKEYCKFFLTKNKLINRWKNCDTGRTKKLIRFENAASAQMGVSGRGAYQHERGQ